MTVSIPASHPPLSSGVGHPATWLRTHACTILRLLTALALLAAVLFGQQLLQWVLPLQRSVYALLMLDFKVYRFELTQDAGHLVVRALAVSQHYLVVQGQAVPPGVGMTALTPARMPLTYAALALVGVLAIARGSTRQLAGSFAVGGLCATALLCCVTPIILAGQQWATVVAPFGEPSLAALLGGLSNVLLHGGGYAAAALAAVLSRTITIRFRSPPSASVQPASYTPPAD